MIARFARTLALALLAWQAVVAQAHVHRTAPGAAAVSAQAEARTTPAPHRSDDPLDCPVCRTLAHVDAFVSPGSFALAPPATAAPWSPTPTLPARRHAQRSHAWRSRAPPIPLHA